MTAPRLPGVDAAPLAFRELSPRERHLIGRITRHASLDWWEATPDDLNLLDALAESGIVDRTCPIRPRAPHYALSAAGREMVKAARAECRACANSEVCR